VTHQKPQAPKASKHAPKQPAVRLLCDWDPSKECFRVPFGKAAEGSPWPHAYPEVPGLAAFLGTLLRVISGWGEVISLPFGWVRDWWVRPMYSVTQVTEGTL
jgi:hypothetical protein